MAHFDFTIQRRHLIALVGVLVAVAILIPGVAWASHSFDDVPDSDWAHADIGWLRDNGLTNGCDVPNLFCPDDNVTRREIAAFIRRLSVAQVVDAGTVEGFTAAELQGSVGPQGPQGVKGDTGPQGLTGSQGPQGEPGAPAPGAQIEKFGYVSKGIAVIPAGVRVTDLVYRGRVVGTAAGNCIFGVFDNGSKVLNMPWSADGTQQQITLSTGLLSDGGLEVRAQSTGIRCTTAEVTWTGWEPAS